jgi:hypothetical protein
MSEVEKPKEPQYEILREDKHRECLESKANWLSKLFFYWTGTVIDQGKSKVLTEQDLFDVISEEKFTHAYKIFSERNKYRDERNMGRNFFRSLLHTSKGVVFFTVAYSVIANLLQFTGRFC